MGVDFPPGKRVRDICLLVRFFILMGLFHASPAFAQLSLVPIESNLRLLNFDHSRDGYQATFRNESPRALVSFAIVIEGRDAGGITVFRRDILVDFMEGYGEKTFFVPGYDRRVFEIKFRVLTLGYEYSFQ